MSHRRISKEDTIKSLHKLKIGLESHTCKKIPCAYCGKIFKQKRWWQYYHDPICRKKAWEDRHQIKDIKAINKEIRQIKNELEELKKRKGEKSIEI